MTAPVIAGHPTPGPARNMLAVENGRLRVENERLRAESSARLAELRASRERIVAAGDAEPCRSRRAGPGGGGGASIARRTHAGAHHSLV
jgi:hypothetical protein